jgi:hypothetical protein
MSLRTSTIVWLAVLGVHEALQAQALAPEGASPTARLEFLKKLDDEGSGIPRTLRERYLLGALEDSSAEVRQHAAYFLRGNAYVPTLIRIATSDVNLKVRQTAAIALNHWITDNGQETCTAVDEVSRNLDQFLRGLEDDATAQYIVEILGRRYSGEKPLPCCMSEGAKTRIVAALNNLVRKPPKHTIASYWSSSIPSEALANIRQCKP